MNWKDIKVNGIAEINKCVGEFQIFQVGLIPSTNFRVKIYENQRGHFTGTTNLGLKSLVDECPEYGIGFGHSIEEVLEDTVKYFMNEIQQRNNLKEEDFVWVDSDDF